MLQSPNYASTRRKLYEETGTQQYQNILSTGKRLRAVARWIMREGLLGHFSLAKEQHDWMEGRARNEVVEEETEEQE